MVVGWVHADTGKPIYDRTIKLPKDAARAFLAAAAAAAELMRARPDLLVQMTTEIPSEPVSVAAPDAP